MPEVKLISEERVISAEEHIENLEPKVEEEQQTCAIVSF